MDNMDNITFIRGNIFNSHAQTLVNTINCVGVMGKGVALVYKLLYPKMFYIYREYCQRQLITIGKLWLYKEAEGERWVLNFPTKTHWRYPSKIEYIEQGLKKFVDTYQARGITSIAFPLLGTQNGGLDKDTVLPMMVKYLSQCTIPVEIYDFDPMAKDDLFDTFRQKWLSIPYEELQSITHIQQKQQLDILDNALRNDSTLTSTTALISYSGIGIKTLETCFSRVMRYAKQDTIPTILQ